jgi:hypothetical protein
MILTDDGYKFECTGRGFYANNCIVGIAPDTDGTGVSISEGYDGGIDIDDMTPEEKIELADYMINLWQQFKK